MAHVTFHFAINVSTLTWTPNPPPLHSFICEAALSTWKTLVLLHEAAHVQVQNDFNHVLQTVLTNYPVDACVDTRTSKVAQLNAERDAYEADIDNKIAALNWQTTAGRDAAIDWLRPDDVLPSCAACAPSPCTKSQILMNGKCLTPCGTVSTSCGYTSAGQQVACCEINGEDGTLLEVCSPYGNSLCVPTPP